MNPKRVTRPGVPTRIWQTQIPRARISQGGEVSTSDEDALAALLFSWWRRAFEEGPAPKASSGIEKEKDA